MALDIDFFYEETADPYRQPSFEISSNDDIGVPLNILDNENNIISVFDDISSAYSSATYSPPTYSSPTHSPPTYSSTTHSPPTHSPPTYPPATHSPPTYSSTTHSSTTHSPPTHSPPTYSSATHSPPTYSSATYSPPTYSSATHSSATCLNYHNIEENNLSPHFNNNQTTDDDHVTFTETIDSYTSLKMITPVISINSPQHLIESITTNKNHRNLSNDNYFIKKSKIQKTKSQTPKSRSSKRESSKRKSSKNKDRKPRISRVTNSKSKTSSKKYKPVTKWNLNKFLQEAYSARGHQFNYSLVKETHFKRLSLFRNEVPIICNNCNQSFTTNIYFIIRTKKNCPKCECSVSWSMEHFFEKCNDIYKDKYNYYHATHLEDKMSPLPIKCDSCGFIFVKTASEHIDKEEGCPKCSIPKILTLENFLKLCRAVHGDKFGYPDATNENLILDGYYTLITVKCNSCCHQWGSFVRQHLDKTHPVKCAWCNVKKPNKYNKFLKDAVSIHGHKYDYGSNDSNMIIKQTSLIKFYCRTCCVMWKKTVAAHIGGRKGCDYCEYRMLPPFHRDSLASGSPTNMDFINWKI